MRPHRSVLQFTHTPDGQVHLTDCPNLTLHTVAGQGTTPGRDWASELGLPTYHEDWERLARFRSDAQRGRMTCVLMDESPTQLTGCPRMHPQQITLPTQCALELGHTGFIVGVLTGYFLGTPPPWLGTPLPSDLEGAYLIGVAQWGDSPLADKAREGVARGLLTHVCPVVWAPPGAAVGTGLVIEVSLVSSDLPGCPHARVLESSTSW